MQAPQTTPTLLIMASEDIKKLEVAPKPSSRLMTKLSIEECDNNDSGFLESPESSSEPSQMTFSMTENRMKHLRRVQKPNCSKPRVTPEADWVSPIALNVDEGKDRYLPENKATSPPTTPPPKPMTAQRMTQLLRAPRSNKRTMSRISPEAEPTATTTTTNNVAAPVALNFDDYDFGIPMRLPFDEDAIREDEEFFFDLSDSEEEVDASELENDADETD